MMRDPIITDEHERMAIEEIDKENMAHDEALSRGSSHDAYRDAAKIDDAINRLLTKYPPEEFPAYWRTFCRTVESSIKTVIGIG